jgi:hypothetical protein
LLSSRVHSTTRERSRTSEQRKEIDRPADRLVNAQRAAISTCRCKQYCAQLPPGRYGDVGDCGERKRAQTVAPLGAQRGDHQVNSAAQGNAPAVTTK